MQTARFRLAPRTAFGTPPRGDQTFGQLCCLIREGAGEAELVRRLEGYTHRRPFLVVSDLFPAGHLPRPLLPPPPPSAPSTTDHKAEKQRVWLPASALASPETWASAAVTGAAIARPFLPPVAPPDSAHLTAAAQPRNSIHRGLGVTSGAEFAPFTLEQYWFPPGLELDLYAAWDPERLAQAELADLLMALGASGFGRDASAGLGKFAVLEPPGPWPAPPPGPAGFLTLAPCAPQNAGPWRHEACFYKPFVRFGRHGGALAVSGLPFKAPLLLVAAGATLMPAAFDSAAVFVGQGLGGEAAPISNALPATVHQGYAPVLPTCLPAPRAAES